MNKFQLILLLVLTISLSAFAQETSESETTTKDKTAAYKNSINLYVENDSRNLGGPGSDRSYSNGIKISYAWASDKNPQWIEDLFMISPIESRFAKTESNYGMGFSHKIFTPSDTQTTELVPNDRPYAGWLELNFNAAFKKEHHVDIFELGLGIVGKEALGEPVQNNFHRMIGVPTNNGWEHQLQFEPTLQLGYTHKYKFWSNIFNTKENTFDVIPAFGLNLGNAATNAQVGATVRLGNQLPDDFGPTRPSANGGDVYISGKSRKDFIVYVFAGTRLIYVARDIFLDGNTFKDSHHVTKIPWTTEGELGFAGLFKSFNYTWRFVTRGPQFKEKRQWNSFASISLGYEFE